MGTKQKKSKVVISLMALAALCVFSVFVLAGSLEPNSPPGPTMHTLDDIYNEVASQQPPSCFAYDMFLQIDGIPGGSTDPNHNNWIDVVSYTFTADRIREASEPNLLELSLVKPLDKASPKLAQFCPNGNHITSVELDICPSTSGNQTSMKYMLTDVTITGVHTYTKASDPLPMEQVSLSFGQIQWEYTDAQGQLFQGAYLPTH